jgi:serine O-acetyltransferase
VLGPIEIGENGRVGSNAVVTKAVPAGATAVGIPGRIIFSNKEESEEQGRRRKAIADKIGFDAYGMTDEMPDPIARSIHNLLDHMHAVDAKIERMSCALGELGHVECTGELPELKTDLEGIDRQQANK